MQYSLLFDGVKFDFKELSNMKKVIDYLAEELKKSEPVIDYLSEELKYKLYRAECKLSGVEAVREDFLTGDIPSCVAYQLRLQM